MRQKGSYWNWYKMMGIIKALQCCQNLYRVIVCPCRGAIYMLEIVKKFHRTRCQVRITGPSSSFDTLTKRNCKK